MPIDVDRINDPSIAIQKKVELWYQSVRPSSSPPSPSLVSPPSQGAGSALLHPITDSRTLRCPSLSSEITSSLETRRTCSPSLSPVSPLEEADYSLGTVNAGLCSRYGCRSYFFFLWHARGLSPESVTDQCHSLNLPFSFHLKMSQHHWPFNRWKLSFP